MHQWHVNLVQRSKQADQSGTYHVCGWSLGGNGAGEDSHGVTAANKWVFPRPWLIGVGTRGGFNLELANWLPFLKKCHWSGLHFVARRPVCPPQRAAWLLQWASRIGLWNNLKNLFDADMKGFDCFRWGNNGTLRKYSFVGCVLLLLRRCTRKINTCTNIHMHAHTNQKPTKPPVYVLTAIPCTYRL